MDQIIANWDIILTAITTILGTLFGIKVASDKVLKYLSKSEDVAESIEYAAGKADEIIEKTKEHLEDKNNE